MGQIRRAQRAREVGCVGCIMRAARADKPTRARPQAPCLESTKWSSHRRARCCIARLLIRRCVKRPRSSRPNVQLSRRQRRMTPASAKRQIEGKQRIIVGGKDRFVECQLTHGGCDALNHNRVSALLIELAMAPQAAVSRLRPGDVSNGRPPGAYKAS